MVLEPTPRGYNFPRQTVSFGLTVDEAGGINTMTNGGQGQNPLSEVCDGNEPGTKSSSSFFLPLNRPE